ncbi:hypothetical protein LTR39_001989 [Cryomyces antarcticus]|nr:hypothetical protein LTR39_001989 [Cryomyces antarcticus]
MPLVKILYTFDDVNKTNCLARFPNVVNVQTVSVDETTQIGVIELRACIEAIMQASPELVAKLGQDYTVYAYDFSEYETPLVGQGMLSWVLASASSTPTAPAFQSKTMITGRVCKNILGIFCNGIKETLEVKLRLVPVPTCLQSEYIENMDKHRNLRQVMPEGFDPRTWTAFLQANPGLGLSSAVRRASSPTRSQRTGPHDGGLDSVHQLLAQGMMSHDDRRNSQQYMQDDMDYTMSNMGYNAHDSRAGSPAPSFRSSTALQQITQDRPSRPSSRTSVRSTRQPVARRGSTNSSGPGWPDQEDEPPKKRARVTQANWRGASAFGAPADSLRVTASTAASIRGHRPVAAYRAITDINSFEAPQRPPTPVPKMARLMQQPSIPTGSSLRREALSQNPDGYSSPYADVQFAYTLPEAPQSSPEGDQSGSAGETPTDFPSSPPVYQAPSSPVLPIIPYNTDSGFMSDSVMTRYDDDDEDRPVDEEDLMVAAQYRRKKTTNKPPRKRRYKTVFIETVPGPPELLPTRIPSRQPPVRFRATRESSAALSESADDTGGRKMPRKSGRSLKTQSGGVPPQVEQLVPVPHQSNDLPNHEVLSVPAALPHEEHFVSLPNQFDNPPNHEMSLKSTAPLRAEYSVSVLNQPTDLSNHEISALPAAPLTQPTMELPQAVPEPPNDDIPPLPAASLPAAPLPQPAIGLLQTVPDPIGQPSCPTTSTLSLPRAPDVNAQAVQPAHLQRSQTWSSGSPYEMHPIAQAPAPLKLPPLPPPPPPPMARKSSNANAKRAKAIQDRVEASLANGEMPPYCSNCGEIKTPTWRKAWYRVESGSCKGVQVTDLEGGITAVDVVERDEKTDAITRYRIIKKSLAGNDTDAGFEPLSLCNPCGLWLVKFRSMRPPDKWVKKEPIRKRGGQRKKKGDLGPAGPQSDYIVDQPSALYTDQISPENANGDLLQIQQNQQDIQAPVPDNSRSASTQPTSDVNANQQPHQNEESDLVAALKRAIQSSPPRIFGTEHSPIELDLDLTPKPTRRLLFPSPRQAGEVKSLDGKSPTESSKLSGLHAGGDVAASLEDSDQVDKENCPPLDSTTDDLDHLFTGPESPLVHKTPKVTPRSSRTILEFLKTPSRSSGPHEGLTPREFLSSAARNLLGPETPSRSAGSSKVATLLAAQLTPFTAQLQQLLSEGHIDHFPSPLGGADNDLDLDWNALPDFGNGTGGGLTFDDLGADFFSTDAPMPSSPPNFFALYEDPVGGGSEGVGDGVLLWSESEFGDEAKEGNGEEDGAAAGKMGKEADGAGAPVDLTELVDEVIVNGEEKILAVAATV